MGSSSVIGVDVGGTTIKGGLIRGSTVIRSHEVPTRAHSGHNAVLESLYQLIDELSGGKKMPIGIGCPGAIYDGVVLASPNLPFRRFNLRGALLKKYKTRIAIDNDANCFAYAEASLGAGKGASHVLGITLGTGLGGGIVMGGKLYQGKGAAAEFGHMTIDYNGWPCKCGSVGCWEEYVGQRGIIRKSRFVPAQTPKELFELAKRGNADAREVWRDIGIYLGVGLANLRLAFDPDVIVIGGQISQAWNFFRDSMERTAQRRSYIPMCNIRKASLGIKAGMIGAGLLAAEV